MNDLRFKHDWHNIDWSAPTSIIAELMGISSADVNRARKKYAPLTVRSVNLKTENAKLKWGSVDWSLSNAEIAKFRACARSVVRKARQRFGKPCPQASVTRARVAHQLKHDWVSLDWSQSTTQIANAMGLDKSHVSQARRKYAPDTLRKSVKSHACRLR